jgi:hypothetical protein
MTRLRSAYGGAASRSAPGGTPGAPRRVPGTTTTELEEPAVRAPLRSVLAGICVPPAVLLAAGSAFAAGPQHSATPSVTAEIGYTSEQVQPGGQDTMTVSLVNHGPQDLDDQTSVHVTVTMPQNTAVDPDVLETIPGNAPTGSTNAAVSRRTVPLGQVFTRSAPGFFDVVVPAGSFGNDSSFRTYAFTLHVAPNVQAGDQLVGGGVAVALENYVGLTVAKAEAPPPVVVPPSKPKQPAKPSRSPGKPRSGGSTGGNGSSVSMKNLGPGPSPSCPSGSGSGMVSAGSGSSGCGCPTPMHQGSGGSGNSGGCSSLAATGADAIWPVAVAVLALAAGTVLLRFAHRSGRK